MEPKEFSHSQGPENRYARVAIFRKRPFLSAFLNIGNDPNYRRLLSTTAWTGHTVGQEIQRVLGDPLWDYNLLQPLANQLVESQRMFATTVDKNHAKSILAQLAEIGYEWGGSPLDPLVPDNGLMEGIFPHIAVRLHELRVLSKDPQARGYIRDRLIDAINQGVAIRQYENDYTLAGLKDTPLRALPLFMPDARGEEEDVDTIFRENDNDIFQTLMKREFPEGIEKLDEL